MNKEILSSIESLFNPNTYYHIWLDYYSISHQSLILCVHDGNWHSRAEIQCTGCWYFSGETKSENKYKLDIKEIPCQDGSSFVEIKGKPENGNGLLVKCLSVTLDDTISKGPYP